MATPREEKATDYLKKHRIMELMDYLISKLFFVRPENPREFLIKKLEQLQLFKDGSLEFPYLYDDSKLDTVFGMMDPTNQRYITYDQYKKALTTLGIREVNEQPEGAEDNRISRETFKKEAADGQQKDFWGTL